MAEKVLIVDDDTDTLRLVGLMLQHQGYSIITASGGAEGIAKAGSEHPDVILLDVMMPEIDGFEVTRRLRADPNTKAIPILMFTARSLLNDRVAAFEVGVDDYLTKPTNPTDLQTHVRQLLERTHEKKIGTAPVASARSASHKIGVLSARAGIGVSTLAMNLAAALQMRGQSEVILVELTPGQGTVGLDLGLSSTRALCDLLRLEADELDVNRVRAALVRHSSGLQVLASSDSPRDAGLAGRSEQIEAVLRALEGLAPYQVLDLGAGLPPWSASALRDCEERIVLTDAGHNMLQHTRVLLDELERVGIPPDSVRMVLNHRVRFDTQFPAAEAEETLAHPIELTLRPAPELMMAATRRKLPGVLAMPEDPVAQQILNLADSILATAESAPS